MFTFGSLDYQKRMYRFQVAAKNEIGQGEWSDAVIYAATAPPLPPTNFNVLNQSTSSITLGWDTTSLQNVEDCDIEGYTIQMEDVLSPGYQTVYN